MANEPAAATMPATGNRGPAVLQLRIGTTEGIATFARHATQWNIESWLLKQTDVNVLAHQPGQPDVVFAGTYGEGLLRSIDAGRSWTKLDVPDLFIQSTQFFRMAASSRVLPTQFAGISSTWKSPASKHWILFEVRGEHRIEAIGCCAMLGSLGIRFDSGLYGLGTCSPHF